MLMYADNGSVDHLDSRILGSGKCLYDVGPGRGADVSKRVGNSLFGRGLACFRWHDDGATVGTMIVDARSLPVAIAFHSPIKQERPRFICAGNGRRLRLFRLGGLRIGCGRGQCRHKCDC